MAKKVLAIGGDGIGPEITGAACYVLEKAGFNIDLTKILEGDILTDEIKKLVDASDAVLYGAGSAKRNGVLPYLRWQGGNYINLRPNKFYPGAHTPLKDASNIDFVIIRENSEGLVPGREGDLSLLAQRIPEYRDPLGLSFADYGEGKYAVRIVSQKGTERLARYACQFALMRKARKYPGKITCVHKNNNFRESDVLFEKIISDEVKKYPELTYEQYFVDDTARRLVRNPQDFDVIVIDNMFGDILSDEAAELVGGLGIAPSGCVGGKVPYFESVSGSAPKYTGKNVVNPTATILSAKLMLEYLGMWEEAAAIEKAVANIYSEGKTLTFDQGGKASTTEFADAMVNKIK